MSEGQTDGPPGAEVMAEAMEAEAEAMALEQSAEAPGPVIGATPMEQGGGTEEQAPGDGPPLAPQPMGGTPVVPGPGMPGWVPQIGRAHV